MTFTIIPPEQDIPFTISEFNISGRPIPETVADKILKYHIAPMQKVRNKLGKSVTPSLKSGYRSPSWEKSKGRSGTSQHTFKGKGAVDWTCEDFEHNKNELLRLIMLHTQYTRMAIYDSFIHCDYKPTPTGKRHLFKSGADSKWEFLREV